MNFKLFSRVCRIAAIGAILLGSASCVYINEELGQNLMPTDQKWDVFTPEPAVLENIQLELADSLSAYSSTRFTFGSINDPTFGTSISSTSFTLVPAYDSIDFGENLCNSIGTFSKCRHFKYAHRSVPYNCLCIFYSVREKLN